MVKFKILLTTPRGAHIKTYYAKSDTKATSLVGQWNEEFKGTGYEVTLIDIKGTTEKLPEGHFCW